MRPTFIAVIAVTLYALPASAQVSIWLQKGVSGYGVSAGLARNDQGGNTFNVAGGYSYQGFLDFSLGLNYYTFDADDFQGSEVNAVGLAPGVQYHPLKQGAGSPISLGLAVGVEYASYSSDDFIDGVSITSMSFGGGASVYRFIRIGERTGITPAAAVNFTHGTITIDTPDGSTDSSGDIVGGTFGGYLAYLDDGGRVWGLVPSITISDDVNGEDPGEADGEMVVQFGISLVVVFSKAVEQPTP